MAKHDDLLEQGPREAPEPETAEERSHKLGLKSTGGVIAGGGVAAAKIGVLGGLGKFFLWAALWNGLLRGGWIALAILVVVAGLWFIRHRRMA
jgi:hypothetical protein